MPSQGKALGLSGNGLGILLYHFTALINTSTGDSGTPNGRHPTYNSQEQNLKEVPLRNLTISHVHSSVAGVLLVEVHSWALGQRKLQLLGSTH